MPQLEVRNVPNEAKVLAERESFRGRNITLTPEEPRGLERIAQGANIFSAMERHATRGGAERERADTIYNEQRANIRAEAQAINRKIEAEQNKISSTRARANRGRARGGLFGDAGQPNQNIVSPRLG